MEKFIELKVIRFYILMIMIVWENKEEKGYWIEVFEIQSE